MMSLIAAVFGMMMREKGGGIELEEFAKAFKVHYENSRTPSYPGCDSYTLGPIEESKVYACIEKAKAADILYQEGSRLYFVWADDVNIPEMSLMPASYPPYYLQKIGKSLEKAHEEFRREHSYYQKVLASIRKSRHHSEEIEEEAKGLLEKIIEVQNGSE